MPRDLHLPVMLEQVCAFLKPQADGLYVDLTVGLGGHARAILQHSYPSGRLLAIDRDQQALELARQELREFADRVHFVHGTFSQLPAYLQSLKVDQVDGILCDLGVSSLQLDRPSRGFSFQQAGPLDMRMDQSQGVSLAERLVHMDVERLAWVLRSYGEVRQAKKVARRIVDAVAAQEIQSTLDLSRVVGQAGRPGRRHGATQVFMALRMMVNQELEQLDSLLALLPAPLKIHGRIAVISFHSLEDRAVKNRFVELEGRCTCPVGLPQCVCGTKQIMKRINRRVVKASASEQKQNPRARSARLRVAQRVA